MPQMNGMMWIFLLMLFSLGFLMSLVKIYFFKLND